MLDIQDFSDVFSFNHRCHYGAPLQNEIHEHRRQLHGQLFIDRLLDLLNIPNAHSYPPRTNADLRALHESIATAPIPAHHQLSLLFYLLLDLTGTSRGGRGGDGSDDDDSAATQFARRADLPRKYRLALLGLWSLDRLDFPTAVGYLTEPSLQPVFHEEILAVLLEHCAEATESASAEKKDGKAGSPAAARDRRGLPLAFYVATNMRITDDELLTRFFRYRCRLSVPRAFSFLRSQAVARHLRRPLLEVLVHDALTATTTTKATTTTATATTMASDAREDRATRAIQLINLPLSEEEEGWFEDYLRRGKGRSLHGATDTVTMRRMGQGRAREVLKERALGSQSGGGQWDQLREGLRRGVGESMTIDEYRLQ